MKASCRVFVAFAIGLAALLPTGAVAGPVVGHSATTERLESLPRRPANQRAIVTIYQFRSGVPEVNDSAATDMFTTALIKSGAFLVAERQEANDVMSEKRLNAQGMTTGNTASKKLAGVKYIFEGAVSEANANENQDSGGVSVGGMTVGGGHNQGEIAIDVRVLDADSGLVLDAIDVHENINSSNGGVSGVGNLLSRLSGQYIPVDANVQHSHNDGVDAALRACIEDAVLELVKRYSQ